MACTPKEPAGPGFLRTNAIQNENRWLSVLEIEWGTDKACNKILSDVFHVKWETKERQLHAACVFIVDDGPVNVFMPMDEPQWFQDYVFETAAMKTGNKLL